MSPKGIYCFCADPVGVRFFFHVYYLLNQFIDYYLTKLAKIQCWEEGKS